jgi:hypothetical protein
VIRLGASIFLGRILAHVYELSGLAEIIGKVREREFRAEKMSRDSTLRRTKSGGGVKRGA